MENTIIRQHYDEKPQFIMTSIAVASSVESTNSPEEFNDAFKWYKALWNTGANKTILSKKILEELNLQPSGEGGFVSPQGVVKVATYKASFAFPASKLYLRDVEVLAQDIQNTPFDVVLGMDVIAGGDFNIRKNPEGGYDLTFKLNHD